MDRLQADAAMKERLVGRLSSKHFQKMTPVFCTAVFLCCGIFFLLAILPLIQQNLSVQEADGSPFLYGSSVQGSSDAQAGSLSSASDVSPSPGVCLPESDSQNTVSSSADSLMILAVFPADGTVQYSVWDETGSLCSARFSGKDSNASSPYLSRDSLFLYFASSAHEGKVAVVYSPLLTDSQWETSSQFLFSLLSDDSISAFYTEDEILQLSSDPDEVAADRILQIQCEILLSGYTSSAFSQLFSFEESGSRLYFPLPTSLEASSIYGAADEDGMMLTGVSYYPAEVGTEVSAPQEATVLYVNRAGTGLILSHGEGLYTLFSHLDSVFLQEGDTVDANTPIGLSGEAPLTVSVLENGLFQNPEAYFQISDP